MQLSTRFSDALLLAAELHASQRRKISDTPYVGHLLAVTGIALAYGGDENEAIAALLHDAIEDQGGAATGELIRARFGSEVAAIVEGCSDTMVQPKPPWRQRKEAHLQHLATASASVRLVTAADKIDNCRSMIREYRQRGELLWTYFRGGREGTLWNLRTTVEVLRTAGGCAPLDELDRAVAEMEELVRASPL
jgi:GTP pyrophosphokinase